MGDIKYKIVVVGDPAVGKTSLVRKYTKGEFHEEYIATLGAQFSRFEEIIDDDKIDLIIWDIAGQEAWEVMRKKFYLGSSAGIVVFSLAPNERDTIPAIQKWVEEIKSNCGDIPVILFGNKIDLVNANELANNDSLEASDANIEQLVKKHEFSAYYKTSALTGERVTDAFRTLVHIIYKKSK